MVILKDILFGHAKRRLKMSFDRLLPLFRLFRDPPKRSFEITTKSVSRRDYLSMCSMKNCFYKGAVPFISETPPTPSPLKAVRLKIGFQGEMGSFLQFSHAKKLDQGAWNLVWGQNVLKKKLFLR